MDNVSTNLPRVTVSSVADLMGCSKKFSELRIKKNWPKGRSGLPISVPRGSAIHDAMRSLHAARWEGTLPVADLPAMAREAVYRARYDYGTDKYDETARVIAACKLFCDNQDREDIDAIIALETQIEFEYAYQGEPLCCISAVIDRALVRADQPDRLVIQDLKTTSQRVDLQECFLQLWCAKQKWPGYDNYALEFIWLDVEQNQVTVDVIDCCEVKGQLKLLTAALLRVLHSEPVAEPGVACTFCPLRGECQGVEGVSLADGEDVF